jgi:hypothetical protein
MARVAAKMMTARGRTGGLNSLFGRAGGGLGRSNAMRGQFTRRPGLNPLARLAQGGDARLGEAIGRFGIVERQPGAFDPGAVPDLGGIDARPTMGTSTSPGEIPAPPGSGQAMVNQLPPGTNTDGLAQQWDENTRTYDPSQPYGVDPTRGIIPSGGVTEQSSGPRTGYVMWQGQMIPAGLYRALQASGELF